MEAISMERKPHTSGTLMILNVTESFQQGSSWHMMCDMLSQDQHQIIEACLPAEFLGASGEGAVRSHREAECFGFNLLFEGTSTKLP